MSPRHTPHLDTDPNPSPDPRASVPSAIEPDRESTYPASPDPASGNRAPVSPMSLSDDRPVGASEQPHQIRAFSLAAQLYQISLGACAVDCAVTETGEVWVPHKQAKEVVEYTRKAAEYWHRKEDSQPLRLPPTILSGYFLYWTTKEGERVTYACTDRDALRNLVVRLTGVDPDIFPQDARGLPAIPRTRIVYPAQIWTS